MPTILLQIIIAVTIVSLVSLLGIFFFLKQKILNKILFFLVSFAAGTFLGVAFLDLLPEAFEGGFKESIPLFILLGILFFFVLEKFLYWHHHHAGQEHEEVHAFTYLNIVGDAIHNFLDGVAIAAAFLISVPIGVATAVAVIFHEIPQEIGQFAILVHGGWSRKKALLYNFFSALTAIAGALLVLLFSQTFTEAPAVLLGLGAASFIYIAMSDLLPELQKESHIGRFALQLFWMIAGIAVMALLLLLE